MLLPEDVHPTNSLYFNGAYVLEALRKAGEVNLVDLFIEARKVQEIQMPLFVLALDWLFLAELVSYNACGNLESCS